MSLSEYPAPGLLKGAGARRAGPAFSPVYCEGHQQTFSGVGFRARIAKPGAIHPVTWFNDPDCISK